MKNAKKQFSEDVKKRAVDEYVSGRKGAVEVAAEVGCSPNLIYRWKADFEAAKRSTRVSELEAEGHNPNDIRRILELEDELEEYKKKLAEQILINDLLKKLEPKSYRPESELTGLIRTTKNSARRRKPVK